MRTKLLTITLTVLLSAIGWSQEDAFITTWKTTAADETIEIPTKGGATYNYDVNWGDGSTETGLTGNATHAYATANTYTVSITGQFPQIYFSNKSQDIKEKIQTIEQWGDIEWSSFELAFAGCTNLTYKATDAPDLSSVTNMEAMFIQATSFNGDLSSWDVSNVTNMEAMFSGATSFNGDLSSWNVSSVTNMGYMFSIATSFNGDISSWNVSSVTTMRDMFYGATSFNDDLSSWDVSSVTDMDYMFYGATSFNGDLSSWNVSSVTYMGGMFIQATSFNGDISSWDVSSVTYMGLMFEGATSFNGDLSSWDVSSVTNMNDMFKGATSFKGDISSWNISNVTDMEYMFLGVTLPTYHYTKLLTAWSALTTVPSGITFNGGDSKYCSSAVAAKENLITNNSWTITDEGEDADADCNPMSEVIEDIAGNSNGIKVMSTQLNDIEGVSGAVWNRDYSTALEEGVYENREEPKAAEIQAVIDSLNAALSTDSEKRADVQVVLYKLNETTLRTVGLPEGKTTIAVYSITGKQVLQNSFNSTSGAKDISLPKLSLGVYLVNFKTEKGIVSKKIIL